MTPGSGSGQEGWERLKRLFHDALEWPPADRSAWLATATDGNEELQREVAALLRAHETAGDFLERPPEIDPADLELPARIGPYDIERELGRGGMGVVYLARDTRLNRQVAVKALPPVRASDDALRERLRREARAAATISHPGIATVYALEEFDGDLFIVSEYVQGGTLREILAAGPLDTAPGARPARALDITTQIVEALGAAHEAGVVHRDLKPENIVIGETGSGAPAVTIVDFGIAVRAESGATRLTNPGGFIGTPAYMAPEQIAGGQGDARSDIYAVGVIFAEMLTGAHPLSPAAPAVPPPFDALVNRCLSTSPAARYASARDLLAALGSTSTAGASTDAASTDATGSADSTDVRAPGRTWWAFHQAAAAAVYGVMLIPAWTARQLIGGTTGRALFILTLAAAVVGGLLRLHLWFTSRWYPEELRRVRQRGDVATRAADALLSLALMGSGLLTGAANDALAVLLFSVGLGIAVAFLVIEPATTRAAFRSSPSGRD